tara:strand:- start:1759 stop:3333 length:1575 start_codon:yes stop_codon:yes gene_type:complete
MTKLNPKDLKKRFDQAERQKAHWRAIYEDAYRYALPNKNLYDGYYEGSVPGQNKMSKVFDSTAMQSTQKFANRIQSGLFPPQQAWCRLQPGEQIPEERSIEVQQILDKYADQMFSVMRQSKFDLAIGEFLQELAIGTAVMLIQPGDEVEPIRYTCIPTFLISYDEGPNGSVEKVYRKMKRPYEVLDQEFPDIKIPPNMAKRYEQNPTEEVEMIEGTYFDKITGNIHYQIIDYAGQEELVYRELKSFPWVISRYSKTAGERYGRGPVLLALPDIKSLNTTKNLGLKNASLSIGGVFTASDDGVLNPNTVRIVPGAIIPVARNGGPQGESLKPLPRSGDPQLTQFTSNDLIASIKTIMLDESLPPDNMSARSATEIQERMKQLSQNLGSAFGRLISETMYPIVRRTLELMNELGMIELPLKVNGLQVKISPTAPLAMAQNMEKVNEVLNYMKILQGLGPQGQLFLNQDKAMDFIADNLGIPASLRTTPEERQALIQQAQQMAQMAQQEGMMDGQGPGTEDPIPQQQ